MPQHQQLSFLIDHAELLEQYAAKAMQEKKGLFEEAKGKLIELQKYQEEYRSRLGQSDRNGLSAKAWRDFYLFLEKLEEAIQMQIQLVERYRISYDIAVGDWNHTRQKHQSYLLLQERQNRSLQQKLAKRDQKESDEYASRHKR